MIILKQLLLVLIIVIGSTKISAQLTWAPPSAEWTYSAYDLNGSHQPFNVAVSEEYLLGDSVIRVVLPEVNTGLGQAANVHLPTTVYGEGDRLYREINGQWHLLYDFTLTIGDTMKLLVDPVNRRRNEIDSFAYFIVDSVGTAEVNGFSLKTQFLRLLEFAQADAGIGFTGWRYQYIGVLIGYFKDRREIGCEGGCPEILRCYSDDVLGSVSFVDFPCDTIFTVGVNDLPDLTPALSLSPNPVTADQLLRLTWNNELQLTSTRLELTDAQGRQVAVSIVSTSTGYEVSTGELSPGLYFLSLTSQEGRAVKRVVIR